MIIHTIQKVLLVHLLLAVALLSPNISNAQPALIPMPQQIVWGNGVFDASQPFQFVFNETLEKQTEELLQQLFPKQTIKNSTSKSLENRLVIINTGTEIPEAGNQQKEAYRLEITPEKIILSASNKIGLYWGLQTLHQLKIEGKEQFASCSIADWPAFSVRGFMQDVGRNYMSLPLLKEQIDVMAAYKFNVFHFHVTDNPGWRLESKKYPELKSPESMSRYPGKFYSQNEFLELVDYCNDRHITLIPEFDVPGHCEAFRKAFGIDSMSDSRVQPILLDLIDELCALVPAEKMPIIHLGTDEVWHNFEKPSPALLPALMNKITENNREMMVWRPGSPVAGDSISITQLWSSNGRPKPGHRYLDSRLNYLNHLDPLNGMGLLFFDRIGNAATGDSIALGGILCCWNDNLLRTERDVLSQNPVYPGMLTYAESLWKGNELNTGEQYISDFPAPGTKAFEKFSNFETRLVRHRDLYFADKPFPYVANAHIPWKIIGPFNHNGNFSQSFPVENEILPQYEVEGKKYSWWEKPMYGGTVHLRHFFGFPSPVKEKAGTVYALTYIHSPKNQTLDCWIGFQGWSRSGGRRGGPTPEQGQWHTTNPVAWVNDEVIPPPAWQQPALPVKSDEIPFVDEDYFYRQPVQISLKKGWNKVLLKVPQGGNSWKWMFTFVPIKFESGQVKEVPDLNYSITKEL